MNSLIVNYNDNMKKFFATTKQLSTANKTTSINTLSPDDALLVTGFKGTEKNHQNCILNIMVGAKYVVVMTLSQTPLKNLFIFSFTNDV